MIQIKRAAINQELDYLEVSIKNLEWLLKNGWSGRRWRKMALARQIEKRDKLIEESVEIELLEAPMEET